MRITSNGNVGIGKINPSYKLNVFGLGDDLTSGSIVAQNSSNTSNAGSLLSVFSADSSGGIGAYPSGNTNISSLAKRVFLTANSSASGLVLYAPNASQDIRFFAGSATEKMRINNLGNVGIGTTSPQRPLHIAGAKQ